MLRTSGEYGRLARDPIFSQGNTWAIRTTFSGAEATAGNAFLLRFFSGDESCAGFALENSVLTHWRPKRQAPGHHIFRCAGRRNLIAAANAEYRIPLSRGNRGRGLFDLGSGWLLSNWLGPAKPLLLPSTNGVLHGSAGIELRWTVPVSTFRFALTTL